MKIRKGFVSNSSSTSFTCEVCGKTESGWDSLSMEEYGFYSCEEDHTICEDCLEKEPELKDNIYIGACFDSEECPICQFEIISELDLKLYLKKLYKHTEEEVLSEIKKINKRRKKVYRSDYINYSLQFENLQILDVHKEIRERFSSYKQFMEFLNEN